MTYVDSALQRKMTALIKTESAYGVDAFAAEASPEDYALTIASEDLPDYQDTPNEDNSITDGGQKLPSGPSVESFFRSKLTFYFRGSGTDSGVDFSGHDVPDVPAFHPIFLASGLVYSTTNGRYTPDSDVWYGDGSSLTLKLWVHWRLYHILGCRGDLSWERQNDGSIMFTWDFMGLYTKPTDTSSIPTGISDAEATRAKMQNANLTIGSWTPKVTQFSMSLGNELGLVKDYNATNGISEIIIKKRDTTITVDPDITKASNFDIYAARTSGTQQALSTTIGSTALNKLVVSAPTCEFQQIPHGEKEGFVKHSGLVLEPKATVKDTDFYLELQ